MSITETRLPNGQIRILPPPEERLRVACRHWTADREHLGRGACALGLFSGTPVLGHCLLKCPEYTGTATERAAQASEMWDKYSRPGERKMRDGLRMMQEAKQLTDDTQREAKTEEGRLLASEGQAERSAYIQRQPISEMRFAGFDPATERQGCCDPPMA